MTKGETRQLCCISVIRVLVTKQGAKIPRPFRKGQLEFQYSVTGDEIPRPARNSKSSEEGVKQQVKVTDTPCERDIQVPLARSHHCSFPSLPFLPTYQRNTISLAGPDLFSILGRRNSQEVACPSTRRRKAPQSRPLCVSVIAKRECRLPSPNSAYSCCTAHYPQFNNHHSPEEAFQSISKRLQPAPPRCLRV
jgi:hypothetical protein